MRPRPPGCWPWLGGRRSPTWSIEGARVFCVSRGSGGRATSRSPTVAPSASATSRAASVSTPTGRVSSPGFIDAHVHVESSKLAPGDFAARWWRVERPRRHATRTRSPTCSVWTASHWFLDAGEDLPLDVLVIAPSCVPASPFESPRADAAPEDIAGFLRASACSALAEMMNFPGVITVRPGQARHGRCGGAARIDGHAPGGVGRQLDAYLAAGIRSRPRARRCDEALDKRRRGIVGAPARGLERAQPARPAAAGARATAPSAARSAPTTASPTCCCGWPHRSDVPRGASPRASRPRMRC